MPISADLLLRLDTVEDIAGSKSGIMPISAG